MSKARDLANLGSKIASENARFISSNYEISSGFNAESIGPVSMPTEGGPFLWDEDNKAWITQSTV